MNLGLKDCKAFIAGASKGLGKACAKALADEGARIFICARNKEALKRVASECDAAGYSAADVSIPAEVKRVMAEAVTALGGLDCLVTNAGGPPTAPFEKADDDDWDTAYKLNLMSAVHLIREALPAFEGLRPGPHRQPDRIRRKRTTDRSRCLGFCSRRRHGHGKNHCV